MGCIPEFPDRRDDFDGDGVAAEADCDDTDADVGGPTDWNVDADGDGFADLSITEAACQPSDRHMVGNNTDCDDTNPQTYPGAQEVCDDVDNDCDGTVDNVTEDLPGAQSGHIDVDQDGYGNPDAPWIFTCDDLNLANNNDDCDDNEPTVFPDAPELCGDGLDNDCNGLCDQCCFSSGDLENAAFVAMGDATVARIGTTLATFPGVGFATSSPANASANGAVWIVPYDLIEPGGVATLSTDAKDSDAKLISGGLGFGASLFETDVNDDGHQDLLVGSPVERLKQKKGFTDGVVFALLGPLDSVEPPDSGDVLVYKTSGPGSHFGASLLGGFDADGDGLPDLAVAGVDKADWDLTTGDTTGAVWLFSGAKGLTGDQSDATMVVGDQTDGMFGTAMGSADTNGDGADELIISAAGPANPQPETVLFEGGSAPGATQSDADTTFIGAKNGANIGASIVLGDFNGDGAEDIALGAPVPEVGKTVSSFVFVFHNDTFDGQSNVPLPAADVVLLGAGPDYAGAGLHAEDMNGDGFSDLLVGAPATDRDVGAVHLCYMGSDISGSLRLSDQPDNTWPGATKGDRAGTQVRAGHFDGDEFPDFVTTAPGAEAVYVWGATGF